MWSMLAFGFTVTLLGLRLPCKFEILQKSIAWPSSSLQHSSLTPAWAERGGCSLFGEGLPGGEKGAGCFWEGGHLPGLGQW